MPGIQLDGFLEHLTAFSIGSFVELPKVKNSTPRKK
jgi:hypothetical protein